MGLAYIAPIGVQNLFVINSALANDGRRALANAWIVFLFDVSLSAACFYGVGYLLTRYAQLQLAVLLVGGAAVLYMGLRVLTARAEKFTGDAQRLSWSKTVLYAGVVTWFNPQAVLDGTTLLGALRASLPPDAGGFFMGGVVCASCLWFTGLTLIVQRCRQIITPQALRWINRVSGAVIIFYGCRLLLQFYLRVC